MNSSNLNKTFCSCLVLLFLLGLILPSSLKAKNSAWQRKQVDWRAPGGSRIKAINYPPDKVPQTLGKRARRPLGKKTLGQQAALRLATVDDKSAVLVSAIVVDSPPIDGYVPLVAVAITDKRVPEMDTIFEATPESPVVGSYLTSNPQSDYAIGIFDTGASAHLMDYFSATQAGLSGSFLTFNPIEISGVTGSVTATVSQPIGIFIDGLGAIEPNGFLNDDSGMVGEWNVAIAVGPVSAPNLPTAIGTPLSVYYTAAFNNDLLFDVNYGGSDINSPEITFYQNNDPCIPLYPNLIPLELRPLGGVSVQYLPTIDPFNPFTFEPLTPSIIIGNLSQSVFFVHSVDLYEGNNSAFDKDRFMFDTGAQVTVIGSRIAARLNLNPDSNDFTVEIEGITGDVNEFPGFYIDTLEIPAIGQWLSFENVPVILIDIPSPEGGTLDGIIGMNLFVDFNFVLRGGGLFLQDDPSLEFIPLCAVTGDIWPAGGDCAVDLFDLAAFAKSWLATPVSPNWNKKCDFAPVDVPDEHVDFLDYAVFAGYWLEETTP
ncbi:MAG: retroviral-like aspartic protease family protein [Sedimentisphaerales bacterium]|nr:retroviral-like aspartic protease family protein [Sedimentisphaerales bacterium]